MHWPVSLAFLEHVTVKWSCHAMCDMTLCFLYLACLFSGSDNGFEHLLNHCSVAQQSRHSPFILPGSDIPSSLHFATQPDIKPNFQTQITSLWGNRGLVSWQSSWPKQPFIQLLSRDHGLIFSCHTYVGAVLFERQLWTKGTCTSMRDAMSYERVLPALPHIERVQSLRILFFLDGTQCLWVIIRLENDVTLSGKGGIRLSSHVMSCTWKKGNHVPDLCQNLKLHAIWFQLSALSLKTLSVHVINKIFFKKIENVCVYSHVYNALFSDVCGTNYVAPEKWTCEVSPVLRRLRNFRKRLWEILVMLL